MYFVGLDLGQKRDFTAVAVVEREAHALRVRHLERMALGTPYPRVVDRVAEIVRHPVLVGRTRLMVDATGVGAPVVDLLRAARLPCRLTPVTITAGEKARGRGEEWRVPKQELLTGLQVLLENRELKIHRALQEAPALVRELTGIQQQKSGDHDDLALAVALGCWGARRNELRMGSQRLPGI